MSDVSTITRGDGLRALADLLDRGLPTPRSVDLSRGRVEPRIFIHHVDDLRLVAGLVDGDVVLTRADRTDSFGTTSGWELDAVAGPLHLTGFVFADRVDPRGVPGVVLVGIDAEAVVA